MKSSLRRLFKHGSGKEADQDPVEHPAVKEARLRRNIGIVIARFFILHERTTDVFIPFENVMMDSMPEWVPGILDSAELSEPEFAAFRFFTDRDSTILDIGAHWGYSAASIWRAGCPANILSFEPNPWQHAPLRRVKELKSRQFDFLGIGLSNTRGTLRFVIPVIEGKGIGGLGSAAIERELAWIIPDNLLRAMIVQVPNIASPVLQFTEAEFTVAPLDEVLASADVTVPVERIAAIKLDVEGWESEVIEGATETLRRHRPALLVEGANRESSVDDRLAALGYRYADFADGRVHLSDEQSGRVGGFYLHEARLDEYSQSGLLAGREIFWRQDGPIARTWR